MYREGWDSYNFWYAVHFDLVETAGESGAFIQSIRLSIGDEFDELVDIDCFGPVRVGAGNSFRVDERIEYCAPYAASQTEVDSIYLEVTFVDDYLRAGRVRIVVPVRK